MNKTGLTTAHVIDVSDPQKEGRVKVRLSRLPGHNDSHWAPVATAMAGGKRGTWLMPEVGDEVLLGYLDGNVDHPYVIGFLWNGQDKPPIDDGIDNTVRRVRTKSGHVIEFDDRSGKEKIHIKSQGGHEITLDDAPASPKVVLKTTGGHSLTLDDSIGGTKVAIETTGKLKLEMDDLPVPTITIDGPSAMLNVTCLQATVTASATVTLETTALSITAPITTFEGVVQIPTLIAETVIGSAYTPAPGNLLGL